MRGILRAVWTVRISFARFRGEAGFWAWISGHNTPARTPIAVMVRECGPPSWSGMSGEDQTQYDARLSKPERMSPGWPAFAGHDNIGLDGCFGATMTNGKKADTESSVSSKYNLPDFLTGKLMSEQYQRWLSRKAQAHCKRDRRRNSEHSFQLADYKQRIHEAVCKSNGIDWYTGETLNWKLISTYNNDESKLGRSTYKAGFALLPTVDHVLKEKGKYEFVICGWRTNDAKNDLSLKEFLELCRLVLLRHGIA